MAFGATQSAPLRTWSAPGRTPNRIRTGATAVKGRGPGPLDDGGPLARDAPARASPSIGPARAALPTHAGRASGRGPDPAPVRKKIGRTCETTSELPPKLTKVAA